MSTGEVLPPILTFSQAARQTHYDAVSLGARSQDWWIAYRCCHHRRGFVRADPPAEQHCAIVISSVAINIVEEIVRVLEAVHLRVEWWVTDIGSQTTAALRRGLVSQLNHANFQPCRRRRE